MYLPEEFPHDKPNCIMMTRIYHPNIDSYGNICLKILKEWMVTYSLKSVLLAIKMLLIEPALDDPLDSNVCNHFINNSKEAASTAVEWT